MFDESLAGMSSIGRQLAFSTTTIAMSSVASIASSSEKTTYDSEEGTSLQGSIIRIYIYIYIL